MFRIFVFVLWSVYVYPRQRRRSPDPTFLEGFEFMERLVHLPAEVRLIAGYLLQIVLAGQYALPAGGEELETKLERKA